MLALAVIQLALAIYVRNTLLDAASEGARFAALADVQPNDGVQRTKTLIEAALGQAYAGEVTVEANGDLIEVRVRAKLPLVGFLGFDRTLEVTGHAARESLR